VLEWVFRRCDGEADARETPIGLVPPPQALDTDGLDISPEALERLLEIDEDGLRAELPQVREHLARFGARLPAAVHEQFERLEQRLA
jgi:phosphoenolpyruvate carboxykinase (GTP)